MWPNSFRNWLKSGSKLTPLWRRDPGLNLSGATCQKTHIDSESGFAVVIDTHQTNLISSLSGTAEIRLWL
jgi:hypothetical protein